MVAWLPPGGLVTLSPPLDFIIVYNSDRWHRYAESQTAGNGERYRDWVCLYASPQDMEKCRLEGHVLEIPQAYETVFEWNGHAVHARSSMPLDERLLALPASHFVAENEAAPGPTSTLAPAQAFSRVLRQQILQDLSVLPVRDEDTHYLERGNVTVYANSPAAEPDPSHPLIETKHEEVLVVYAPCSLTSAAAGIAHPQQLEFASFVLRKTHDP